MMFIHYILLIFLILFTPKISINAASIPEAYPRKTEMNKSNHDCDLMISPTITTRYNIFVVSYSCRLTNGIRKAYIYTGESDSFQVYGGNGIDIFENNQYPQFCYDSVISSVISLTGNNYFYAFTNYKQVDDEFSVIVRKGSINNDIYCQLEDLMVKDSIASQKCFYSKIISLGDYILVTAKFSSLTWIANLYDQQSLTKFGSSVSLISPDGNQFDFCTLENQKYVYVYHKQSIVYVNIYNAHTLDISTALDLGVVKSGPRCVTISESKFAIAWEDGQSNIITRVFDFSVNIKGTAQVNTVNEGVGEKHLQLVKGITTGVYNSYMVIWKNGNNIFTQQMKITCSKACILYKNGKKIQVNDNDTGNINGITSGLLHNGFTIVWTHNNEIRQRLFGFDSRPIVTINNFILEYNKTITPNLILDNSLVLSDADNTILFHAKIQISDGYKSDQDRLYHSISNPGFWSGWYKQSGSLIITGNFNIGDLQNILRGIKYNNTREIPTKGTRKIFFEISDNILTSEPKYITLNVLGEEETNNDQMNTDNIFSDTVIIASASAVGALLMFVLAYIFYKKTASSNRFQKNLKKLGTNTNRIELNKV